MKKNEGLLNVFSLKKLIINSIKFYQQKISANTRPRCRFIPTCSSYTITSIERFGIIKGGFMSMYRILRCNPFCKSGYDPVPEKKKDLL